MGQNPTRKTTAYIRRMITTKKWEVNSKIPPIREIAEKNGVCWASARKAMRNIENEGRVRNYGKAGFFVVHNLPKYDDFSSLKLNYVKNNLKAAKLLNNGGISIGQYVLKYCPEEHSVEVLDVVSNYNEIINLAELLEYVNSPVNIKQLLAAKNKKDDGYPLLRTKYEKQKRLGRISRIVSRHKRELSIDE